MPTQISDVVVPAEFSAYIAENSLVSTALFQSGVLVPNCLRSPDSAPLLSHKPKHQRFGVTWQFEVDGKRATGFVL